MTDQTRSGGASIGTAILKSNIEASGQGREIRVRVNGIGLSSPIFQRPGLHAAWYSCRAPGTTDAAVAVAMVRECGARAGADPVLRGIYRS